MTTKKRILVVEDDQIISDGLKRALEVENYHVEQAFDGEDGVFLAKTTMPDLLILDVMMPFMNGFEVITELRRERDWVPILILSARTEAEDKVRGLDLGADDYLAKPFNLDELLARVRRLLREQDRRRDQFGDWIYSWEDRQLFNQNRPVELGSKERGLLEFFLKRSGQIVSRSQILDAVWGGDYSGTDRTVDNLVVSLRKKIGSQFLITVRGEGYRFVTHP